MASEQWLIEKGFRLAGEWRTPNCIVHRTPWLRRANGLYAFVVQGEVGYIGKASGLHRRLRNYSNRTFRQSSKRELREVHQKIRFTVHKGTTAQVYAMLARPDDTQSIGELEGALIREIRPPWNVNLHGGVR